MAGFRIQIKDEKKSELGWIEYDSESKEIKVEHPDANIKEAVEKYLSSPRKYRIPESQRLDDYREEVKVPTESMGHMELAMSGGFYRTGAMVLWETRQEF
jgi:hypothetical protein